MKTYFSNHYIQYFKDLAANNHKDWFDANRKVYEKEVKKPFEAFVSDLIAEMAKKDKGFEGIKPSDCIFRINRDVRFSQDKTPYKIQMSALVTKNGKKDMNGLGVYIEFGPEFTTVYGGIYMPDKNQLEKIRNGILAQSDEFAALIKDARFLKYFPDGIMGEKNKVLPALFKSIAEKEPHIYNKQFYWMHRVNADKILEPGLLTWVMEHYDASKSQMQFFINALGK